MNFLKPVLRNLSRHKRYGMIHVFGLTLGIASFLLIQLYIQYEESFDRAFPGYEHIYRFQEDRYNQGELRLQTVAANAGLVPAVQEQFPEVIASTQFVPLGSVVQYNDISFKEDHMLYATRDFFRVFRIPLVSGVDSMVLKEPFDVVLSATTARRYFGDTDPIGKQLRLRGKMDLRVTGVYQDLPTHTHFKADLIASYETYFKLAGALGDAIKENPWRWDGFYTYIVLRPDADVTSLEAKFPKWIESSTGAWLKETAQDLRLHLQPLSDIYLHSAFSNELEANNNARQISYLQWIALFLLAIAWINYISLTTAKAAERALEVGIRKVLGSQRAQLVWQFLLESLVLNVIALLAALLLLWLVLPYFNVLVERDLSWRQVGVGTLLSYIITMLLAGPLVSGFYPAWILSSFRPVTVLKGRFQTSAQGRWVRKIFVVVPFAFTIMLITALYSIHQQITYLRSLNKGFSTEQKLVIRDSEIYDSLYKSREATFRRELERVPGIRNITYVVFPPGDMLVSYANSVRRLAADEKEANQYKFLQVDHQYVDVFDLKILAGHNLTDQSREYLDVLVNEKACRLLGFKSHEEALEQKVIFRGDTVTIKGVTNDFYHESPKHPLQPVIYVYEPNAGFFFVASLDTEDGAIVERVRDVFTNIFPAQPFDYFFLNDRYDAQFKAEARFARVVGVFTVLLLSVAGVGLFGLSLYAAMVRRREVGIRKVLGASEQGVVWMLFREYLMLVAIAALMALPISWYLMQQWLQGFAQRIVLHVGLFIWPCLVIVGFALLIISFQSIRLALTNPARVLRQDG